VQKESEEVEMKEARNQVGFSMEMGRIFVVKDDGACSLVPKKTTSRSWNGLELRVFIGFCLQLILDGVNRFTCMVFT
jgi:hypothetical protein